MYAVCMLDNHFLRSGGLQLYLSPCVRVRTRERGLNASFAAVASACESSFTPSNNGYNTVGD